MTYTLSDGSTVAPGDIVELVDGPGEMLLFGDRVSVHRMSVREIDAAPVPGKVPTLAHPFMLWFDAAELRRVETIECIDCGELVPADASDDVDDGWHDRQTHDERETWQGDALPDNVTADGGTTYTVRQED